MQLSYLPNLILLLYLLKMKFKLSSKDDICIISLLSSEDENEDKNQTKMTYDMGLAAICYIDVIEAKYS